MTTASQAPSIAERVSAGVAFLDRTVPMWDVGLDLSTLSIASSESCVLGQIFDDFDCGRRELGLSCDMAVTLGLMVLFEDGMSPADLFRRYNALTDEWVLRLAIRQGLVASQTDYRLVA